MSLEKDERGVFTGGAAPLKDAAIDRTTEKEPDCTEVLSKEVVVRTNSNWADATKY